MEHRQPVWSNTPPNGYLVNWLGSNYLFSEQPHGGSKQVASWWPKNKQHRKYILLCTFYFSQTVTLFKVSPQAKQLKCLTRCPLSSSRQLVCTFCVSGTIWACSPAWSFFFYGGGVAFGLQKEECLWASSL